MISKEILNLTLDGICIVVFIMVTVDFILAKQKTPSLRAFLTGVFLSLGQVLSDMGIRLCNGNKDLYSVTGVCTVSVFIFGYLSIVAYSIYQFYAIDMKGGSRRTLLRIYEIAGVASCIATAVLGVTGKLFSVNEDSEFLRGDLWILCMLYPLLVILTNCIVVFGSHSTSRQRLAFALASVIMAMGYSLTMYYEGYSFVTAALLLAVVLLYINSYTEKNMRFYETENELNNSRMEVMISQIQPHFLYNSISSAVALCRIDPEKAAETMANFGKYLRGNLDSLKKSTPIPFTEELKHIEVYVQLEKTRLGDKLEMKYETSVTDFEVPALSVQPLVENAVQHGIAEAGIKGIVTLKTYEDPRFVYIQVVDNGQGFDPLTATADERSHIGISSVRSRIGSMVNGAVIVRSKPGDGTTVTIKIPKYKRI